MASKAEKLDNLARAIDAPREKGRIKNIRKVFAEYAESLNHKQSWWQKVFNRR